MSLNIYAPPRQSYWPYHPPRRSEAVKRYFIYIAQRENDLYILEKKYRFIIGHLRSSLYTKFKRRYKKYDEFDRDDLREFWGPIDMSKLGHYLEDPEKENNRRLVNVSYTRAWKHLGGKLSGRRRQDITEVLFTHLYEYCLGERVLHHEQAKGMRYLLDQLTMEDMEDISCDMDLHDIKSIKDINDLSSALIQCVCQGLIPLSYAEKLHGILKMKMTFLYYGEDIGKLQELEQLVDRSKGNK